MLAHERKPPMQQPGQMGTNFGTTDGFSISDSQRQRSKNVEKGIW
jgi:hypothetical protein